VSDVLEVEGLRVVFDTARGPVEAVRGIDLHVGAGERLAVVGESGSGKSQTFLAVAGLLAPNGRAEGRARLGAMALPLRPDLRLRRAVARQMGFVFQDHGSSLNPYMSIGRQMAEGAVLHLGLTPRAARAEATQALRALALPDVERVLASRPHQLSGGMRQRVMIAAAWMVRPALIVADEPTTALDVTVQAEVLAALRAACDGIGAALVLITHDVGVAAALCDRVAVMHRGRIVETGATSRVLSSPQDAYTAALVGAARGA
jgi:ABC-type glutathione transport system ATPase component